MTTPPTDTTANDAGTGATAERPPLPWLLGYRFLGLRLPERYRPWVAQDVADRLFLGWRMARTALWGLVLIGLFAIGQNAFYQPPTRKLLMQLALFAVAAALLPSGRTLVRRTLLWQRVDRYGRPFPARGLARLDNAQAVLLGVAVLVAFTGAAGVFGDLKRPKGFAGARCRPLDSASLRTIRAALKDPDAKIESPRQAQFGRLRFIAAIVDPSGDGPPRGLLLHVENGVYSELAADVNGPLTNLPRPKRIDRNASEGLLRVSECLRDARS